MNNNIQSKANMLQELESLLAQRSNAKVNSTPDTILYCEYMKRIFLSCSTNN